MEKEVIVRKDHNCAYCNSLIKKGETANYMEVRGPRYDVDDFQIGIHFYKEWYCIDKEKCINTIFPETTTQ